MVIYYYQAIFQKYKIANFHIDHYIKMQARVCGYCLFLFSFFETRFYSVAQAGVQWHEEGSQQPRPPGSRDPSTLASGSCDHRCVDYEHVPACLANF